MDLEHARAYLREHHHAVIATFRRDGRPQLTPVVCAVDDTGRVVVSTRETAYKTRHLERDPRVAVCVFPDGFFGDWVQVEGTATVVHLPDALDGLVDYYRRVAGEHPDWDEYCNAMERERRVLVRIDIERVGPSVSG